MARISVCRLDYRRFNNSGIDTVSDRVKNGLYVNTAEFPSPTVDAALFETDLTKFNSAASEYELYGITKRTPYTTAKKVLIDDLDNLSMYVNSVAKGDVSLIALSGFEPSRELPQPSQPLLKIEGFTVKRTENSGEIVINIPAIVGYGIVNYGCICFEGTPPSNLAIINSQTRTSGEGLIINDYSKSRRKVISGLTPGKMYYIYVFASNAVSVSPISDVRQIMAA